MKQMIFVAMIASASFGAIASPKTDSTTATVSADKPAARPPKGCPAGFVPMGVITQIETSKKGMVTESIRTKGGSIQKMPAFKPTKLYNNKVGDAYCMDTTDDND